uniref:SCAN box domain-containing protein n=1 Tax=Oncorhynchus tshawytscha TaxID=74940 RepID=A0A8C8K3K5_ONCTS
KMTDDDDPEAYLSPFERVAERGLWDRMTWSALLAPISQEKSNNRSGLNPFPSAQWFSTWKYQAGQAPRVQSYHLSWLGKNWLKPQVNSVDEVIDKVVLDRFMRPLSYNLHKAATQQFPQTHQDIIQLVEKLEATKYVLNDVRYPLASIQCRWAPIIYSGLW